MIRVLVVLPFYGGSLPIGRFAAKGLEEAGCLVEVFEAPGFYGAYSALQELKVSSGNLDALQNDFLRFVSQAVIAKAEHFKPDLVLSMAQAPLSKLALRRLKQMNITTAMWFVEDHALFTYWRAFAPHYDIFAVIQKEPFFSKLAEAGVANHCYLPLAALPSFHKPLELSPVEAREFSAEVSFLGAGYPNRRKAFTRLKHTGLKIWGTEWEGEAALAPLVQRGGARISPEDAVRIFNASAINLNLHSSIKADEFVSHGDFVNPRTFEVAACGAFQLVDKRALMPELFAEDELATFESLEELEEKIAWFKAHPAERAEFAQKSYARVLRDHTYKKRMSDLLDFIAERVPDFGKGRETVWPENMPETTKEDITALLAELHLPEDAAFSDVITAVRMKNERLSDVETALLFLDEWQKLYMPAQ